jgi:hypothetical protein
MARKKPKPGARDAGASKVVFSEQKNGPLNSETANAKQYAVTSGRTALGRVKLTAAGFVAIDSDGKTVGRFRTLREAVRAFPRDSQ